MKRLLVLLALLSCPITNWAASTINNTNAFSWGANIGWLNWHETAGGSPPGPDGVVIGEYICQGWIYGANVGWISMSRTDAVGTPLEPVNHIQYSNTLSGGQVDYGVNYVLDPTQPGVALLRGFAYGPNIGWINFDAPGFSFPAGTSRPRLSLFTGKLTGYIYSANCGWISLDEFDMTTPTAVERYVQTDHVAMGIDTDGDGIADAFEYLYFGNLTTANGLTGTDADGDGMSDKDEYLNGTNPTISGDKLHITSFATNSGGTSSPITWTSNPARLYVIETNPDLLSTWTLDPNFGVAFAPDAGTSTTRTLVGATATKKFYRVRSIRPLP